MNRVGTDSNAVEESDETSDEISTDSNVDIDNVEGNYGSQDVCEFYITYKFDKLLNFRNFFNSKSGLLKVFVRFPSYDEPNLGDDHQKGPLLDSKLDSAHHSVRDSSTVHRDHSFEFELVHCRWRFTGTCHIVQGIFTNSDHTSKRNNGD